MKKSLKIIVFLSMLVFLLNLACGTGGKGTDTGGISGLTPNNNPRKPDLTTPSNDASDVQLIATLEWIGNGDPDLGDSVKFYTVYLDSNSNPSTKLTDTDFLSCQTFPLNQGTTYYWRVVAHDQNGGSTSSDTWKFTTYGYSNTQPSGPNKPPFKPDFPYPSLDKKDVSYKKVALFWTGGDPEGDDLTYDVYFDTGLIKSDKMSKKVASGITASRFDITDDLLPGKNYSWQIECFDTKGNNTLGNVWRFTTAKEGSLPDNLPPYPPFNPSPFNGDGGQPTNILLSWAAEDPDMSKVVKFETVAIYDTVNLTYNTTVVYDTLSVSDKLTFDIYLDTEVDTTNTPKTKIFENYASNSLYESTLTPDQSYFWKVIVKDDHGNETPGPTWMFYTGNWAGGQEGNNPPFTPTNPMPFNGQQETPLYISLNWSGGDPDPGDYVTYSISGSKDIEKVKNGDAEFFVDNLSGTNFVVKDKLEPNTWYYWQVTAEDTQGHIVKGDVWSFHTGQQGEGPWVGNPQPGNWTVGHPVNIKLTWDGGDPNPANFVKYEVYFDEATAPMAPNFRIETTDKFFTPGQLKPNTLYVWRVVAKAQKPNGYPGGRAESQIWHFSTGNFVVGSGYNNPPFVPNSPYPNQQNNVPTAVTLTWMGGDPDGNPVNYEVHLVAATALTTAPNYENIPLRSNTFFNNTTLWVDGLASSTIYYWYVKAKDNNGGESKSPIWSFTTGSFINNPPWVKDPWPVDWQTNIPTNITLLWNGGDPEGDHVEYEIYFGEIMPLPKIGNSGGGTSFGVMQQLKVGVQYQWQIVARDDKGHTTYGPIWHFTTGQGGVGNTNQPPYPPSAPNPWNMQNNVPTTTMLNWMGGDPNGDSVDYDIHLGTLPLGQAPTYDNIPYWGGTYANNTSYPISGLVQSVTYFWYVKAKDNKGGENKSPIWAFTTGSAQNTAPWVSPPTMPGNGDTGVSTNVNLSWAGGDPDVGDSVTYDVYLGRTWPLSYKGTAYGVTNFDIPEKLDEGTVYQWQIVAKDDKGHITNGPIWTFTTGNFGNTNQPPFQPYNPVPSINQTTPTALTLSWMGGDPNGDLVDYEIHLGTLPQGVAPTYDTIPYIGKSYSDYTNYWVEGLNNGATYFWYVKAMDNKGGENKSPIWAFTTSASVANTPPWVGSPSWPDNGATGISTTVTVSWSGSDSDPGDTVSYDVYFGYETTWPLQLVGSTNQHVMAIPGQLGENTNYKWYISARDIPGGHTTMGPVWHFQTGVFGFGNQPPYKPMNPVPSQNFILLTNSVTFSWTGGDPDKSDVVTYTIYLMHYSNGVQVKDHYTVTGDTKYTVNGLSPNTLYSWKVVANDGNNLPNSTTESDVWTFATGPF